MKKSTGFIIKGIILVIVIALFGGYYIKNNKKDKGIVVKEWNNLYNENNITLYYENINNNMKESLVNLNNTYNILEIVQKEEGELNKVLKTVDIVNSIVNYDDVANSRSTDAYNILKGKGENRKVSFRDMAIISRDIILVSGYEARVGIFRNGAAEYSKNQQYYVVEYWSNEYNKWIMIDFRDKGYFKKEETPLSAIEIIDSSLKNIEYIGNTKEDKYKKSLKKYLESYHMAIENRLSITRSNSNLAYVKNEKSIIVKLYNEYMPPTIFTTDATLFNNKPGIIAQEKDEKIYII